MDWVASVLRPRLELTFPTSKTQPRIPQAGIKLAMKRIMLSSDSPHSAEGGHTARLLWGRIQHDVPGDPWSNSNMALREN